MGHWDEVRRQARARHEMVLDAAAGNPAATALLAAAERLSGVARVPLPAGDPLLDGADALLDRAAGVILFSSGVEPWRASFYQAHEYAHLWLDQDRAACTGGDLDIGAGDDGLALGPERVEGYGPRERREREANVFALEFLLPGPGLRRWYHDEGLDAAAIAARTGLPEAVVSQGLMRALLAPPPGDQDGAVAAPVGGDLDESQRRAAHAPHGPLLVEAGPGTGKTRTLVARILFLLEQGVPASEILALTFSQRAAEEMRARVAAVAPQAAASLWAGTFHAFGLEIVRKYGTRLGLPPTATVLDPMGALFWLERRLPELEIDHERSLHEPALPLRELLAAISRAKDELIGPTEYAGLAGEIDAAADPDAAARAREVAHVYAAYQAGLQRDGLLDFGDLIARAVTLLREHPDVRAAARSAYPQILVDEYQDVNRASGLLLRELADDGAGLWVVGDARQAIYRFRGAAPANMRLFAQDFPGAAVLALRRNYRSRPEIVATVSAVAPRMRATAGMPFVPWETERAAGGEVRLEIAADEESEVAGLARTIAARLAGGLRYGEQAVLCRSHTALARVGAGLEAAGIPVLYLGDVFERPEVRDMLALLSLICEGKGHGLVRVARFAEYAIPLADVVALLAWAETEGIRFPRALSLTADAPGISAQGREGLALLARHLDGLAFGADAWSVLARYLFSRSGYLRSLAGDGPSSLQRHFALYQFLRFAADRRGLPVEGGDDAKKAFLRHVRRLESLGEDRGLRQGPEGAGGIDAVRLLTIHASKGLEFKAVYLPMLAQRYFPAPRQREPYPLPARALAAASDEHEEEEECLFFVAASRARDVLYLSRAQRYGRRGSKPSRLLGLLGDALPGAADGPVTWPGEHVAHTLETADADQTQEGAGASFEAEALELYLACPRRYYYAHELGLRRGGDDDAYSQFQRCVREVADWLWAQAAQGLTVDRVAAQARLDEVWQARGLQEHPHDGLYRRAAATMIARLLARPAAFSGRADSGADWELALPHGRVRLRPSRVGIVDTEGNGAETVVVQQVRTSRGDGGERQKRLAALHQAAAAQAHPAARHVIQTVSLATAEVEAVALDGATVAARLAHYDGAIQDIQRRRFAPRPDDRRCPRCPYYFICPAAD